MAHPYKCPILFEQLPLPGRSNPFLQVSTRMRALVDGDGIEEGDVQTEPPCHIQHTILSGSSTFSEPFRISDLVMGFGGKKTRHFYSNSKGRFRTGDNERSCCFVLWFSLNGIIHRHLPTKLSNHLSSNSLPNPSLAQFFPECSKLLYVRWDDS
jgi:hypothetical protein